MDAILFLTDYHAGSHVALLAGIYDRAAARRRWRVVEIELGRTKQSIGEILRQWRPAGCLMECGRVYGEDLTRVFGPTPVVFIDPDETTLRAARHTVSNDSVALVRTAAAELLRAPSASFAYFGWCEPTVWSRTRGETFARLLKDAGKPACAVFEEPWDQGDSRAFQMRVAEAVRALPKPIGILAANDFVAQQVADACREAGLVCPRDFTLVGFDNDGQICENSDPTISSVEPDFREGGRLAYDLLSALIDDPTLPSEHRAFAPLKLARRESSRTFAVYDKWTAHVVERIRREAADGLSVADVLADVPISRRLAEKRFLAATGKTILKEIQDVRFARVCELLMTDVPIGHIASRCGMESSSYLQRFFKARTGLTLRAWRLAHAR